MRKRWRWRWHWRLRGNKGTPRGMGWWREAGAAEWAMPAGVDVVDAAAAVAAGIRGGGERRRGRPFPCLATAREHPLQLAIAGAGRVPRYWAAVAWRRRQWSVSPCYRDCQRRGIRRRRRSVAWVIAGEATVAIGTTAGMPSTVAAREARPACAARRGGMDGGAVAGGGGAGACWGWGGGGDRPMSMTPRRQSYHQHLRLPRRRRPSSC